MQYYLKTNLPRDPLKSYKETFNEVIEQLGGGGYIEYNPDILNAETLSALDNYKLTPWFVVVFAYSIKFESNRQPFIHVDITHTNNKWHKLSFGLHYDLFNNNQISWFDVPSNTTEVYPTIEDGKKFKLRGIHYNKKLCPDLPVGTEQIDSAITGEPLIIRTDVPHRINFNKESNRLCICIRFKESLKNWSTIVNHLRDSVIT